MTDNKKKLTIKDIHSPTDLKVFLATNYLTQIKNFFDDEKQAMKFMSSVMADVQKTPKLLECDPTTLINSYMTMAQLGLMPSSVSGEAYVLPYNNKSGMVAQFQLGYQGMVTLFYRAGVRSIVSEIVYKNDKFEVINAEPIHKPDVFSNDRGEAVGAYVIIELQGGGKIYKVMSKKEILEIGEKFSKSYYEFDYTTKKKTENIGKHTPWNENNDPQLWMWKKTVLKQIAKLVPKNETIYKAIAEDNKDSVISDRNKMEGLVDSSKLKMGQFLENGKNKKEPIEDKEGGAGSDKTEGDRE